MPEQRLRGPIVFEAFRLDRLHFGAQDEAQELLGLAQLGRGGLRGVAVVRAEPARETAEDVLGRRGVEFVRALDQPAAALISTSPQARRVPYLYKY